MQGLQVFDGAGNLVFDSSTQIARVIGVISGSLSSPSTGFVEVPTEYYLNNTVFYTLLETAVDTNNKTLAAALSKLEMSIVGNRINYKNLPCNVLYGVY